MLCMHQYRCTPYQDSRNFILGLSTLLTVRTGLCTCVQYYTTTVLFSSSETLKSSIGQNELAAVNGC